MKFTTLAFDSIDSTNSEAIRNARLGGEEGLIVMAKRQTEGRGRNGRKWISPKDSGLYFSIVLRPKGEAKYLPLITLMAGVAVHDTVETFGVDADIKWVNDVLVRERKIAGILAETADTSIGLAVVVGIGINLRLSDLADEIADNAISIAEAQGSDRAEAERFSSVSFDEQFAQVGRKLTGYLEHFYQVYNAADGPQKIVNEWRERSTYFSGKDVRVVLANETILGTTDGLEENGALRLRSASGELVIIQSGDVEQLRAAK